MFTDWDKRDAMTHIETAKAVQDLIQSDSKTLFLAVVILYACERICNSVSGSAERSLRYQKHGY